MKPDNLYTIYLSFLLRLGIICLTACLTVGQSVSNFPKENSDALRDNFFAVLIGEKTPGGLVLVTKRCSQSGTPVQEQTPPGTVRERLEYLVLRNPEYRVVSENGVFNLLPANSDIEFLNVKISEFNFEINSSPAAVLDRLLNTKEITPKVQTLRLNKALEVGGGLSSPKVEKMMGFVQLRDVTVFDALNSIAKSYGAIWLYTQSHCNGETLTSLKFPVQF